MRAREGAGDDAVSSVADVMIIGEEVAWSDCQNAGIDAAAGDGGDGDGTTSWTRTLESF